MKRRLLAAIGLVVMAVAGWAAPAFAHAQVVKTEPAAETVLAKSPGQVVVHFSESVEIQLGAVRVFDAHAKRLDSGASTHPHGDSRAVAVSVPNDLPDGGYVVTWRVISADSHPVHGAFTFLIGQGGGAAATKAEASRLLGQTTGSVSVGVIYGIVRFASFASLFVLVGGAALVAGAWPEGASDRRARRLLLGVLLVADVATVIAIAIQGPYAGGLPLAKMFSPSVVGAVLHTRFGRVYVARMLLLVAALPLLRMLLRSPDRPPWWSPAAGVVSAGLLVTPGLAGHAAAGSLVALAVPFDLIHVAAAAVWVGGLAVLAVAALAPRDGPAGKAALSTVAPRFSQWALGLVVAIAVTGGFAAWRQVGSLSAVTTTPFGRLVLAKTIIFVVLVAVGSSSRRLIHGNLAVPFRRTRRHPPPAPRPVEPGALTSGPGDPPVGPGAPPSEPGALTPGTGAPPVGPGALASGPGAVAAPAAGASGPPRRRRSRAQRQSALRRAVLIEVALAAAIIAVTAVLVQAQPGRQAAGRVFSTEVRAGPSVLVDVVVDPAQAGPVAIHLYTLSSDGAQLDVPEVTATLALLSAGISNLTVPLERGGTGHFLVSQFVVPLKGTWALAITVRTTEFDAFPAAPVTVRMS